MKKGTNWLTKPLSFALVKSVSQLIGFVFLLMLGLVYYFEGVAGMAIIGTLYFFGFVLLFIRISRGKPSKAELMQASSQPKTHHLVTQTNT